MTKSKDKDLPLYISSGSTVLNLVLTNTVDGGWPIGKIVNIVGDKSSGKTLLAVEAITYAIKVLKKDYNVKVRYLEAEAAFDKNLAELYGMPHKEVEFVNDTDDEDDKVDTVEGFYTDLVKTLEADDHDFMVYIVDSLDALSDESEMLKDINKADFNRKAGKLSELFRKLIRQINNKNVLIIIISQIRDNIGVTFGEKKKRSGGHSLDFYASQVVWLYEKGKILKNDKVVGVNVRAKVKKNKVWKPFREADFSIIFEYGIDEVGGLVDFLNERKFFGKSKGWLVWEEKKYRKEDFIHMIEEKGLIGELRSIVKELWDEEEKAATIIRKPKYE